MIRKVLEKHLSFLIRKKMDIILTILLIIMVLNLCFTFWIMWRERNSPDFSEHLIILTLPYTATFWLILGLGDHVIYKIKPILYQFGYVVGIHNYNADPYALWLRIRNTPRKIKRKRGINFLSYRKTVLEAYNSRKHHK